jgi:cutinase
MVAAVPQQTQAASCPDVEVAFARGTGEAAGLGITGRPFASSLASALSGYSVNAYAVDYAANAAQTSAGPGATDMVEHVTSVAADCPNTRFVLGGYSQGATVTDIAIGIRAGTTSGQSVPAELSDRVAAIVVFGNPLGMMGRTIAQSSSTYASRAKEYCNNGDPICGGGASMAAHLTYASNGSTTDGAQFAAKLITSGAAPSGGSGNTDSGNGSPAPSPSTGTGTGTGTTPSGSLRSGLCGLSELFGGGSGSGSSSLLASLLGGSSGSSRLSGLLSGSGGSSGLLGGSSGSSRLAGLLKGSGGSSGLFSSYLSGLNSSGLSTSQSNTMRQTIRSMLTQQVKGLETTAPAAEATTTGK